MFRLAGGITGWWCFLYVGGLFATITRLNGAGPHLWPLRRRERLGLCGTRRA